MRTVFFSRSGRVAHFDDQQQQAELQINLLHMYCDFLVSKGVDPTECKFYIDSVDPTAFVTVHKTEYGWWVKQSRD